MSDQARFMIRLKNYFYALELLNERGAYVYDLREAKDEADRQYGNGWSEVYNGHEGAINEPQEEPC